MTTKPTISNIVGLKELRLNIKKYIKLLQKGHSFIVVRKSSPVFKLEPIDSWGDDGTWETVADFASLQPENGIPMSDLMKKLKAA